MKVMILLVIGFTAFLFPSTSHAAEPSLASVMERFSKEPNCGPRFMGVGFTLIAEPPNPGFRYIASDFTANDPCLSRREILGMAFPRGSVRDGSYYEFKASGSVSLSGTAAPGQTATFELTLGQPPIGFIQKRRPDLGTLVITYRNGARQHFTLPDSLTITAVGNSNHFIYGEIRGGAAVISLLIKECVNVEGCG